MMSRSDLIAMANGATNVPAPIRAMAGLFILRMSDEQVQAIADKIETIKSALEHDDWEGITALAQQFGLPKAYIDHAHTLYQQNKDQPPGQ